MNHLNVLLCCYERTIIPASTFDGAFAGLNILMEDTIQYVNSGYSPSYENVKFTSHSKGFSKPIKYINKCY